MVLQTIAEFAYPQRNGDETVVKLKDIAEACNVSVATVSRALNGLTDTNRGRTEEIRRVAREMGYYPNAAARALKTNRSNNIGILYEDKMNHEYFSVLLDSLRENAEVNGYDLTFISRTDKAEHVKGERLNYYEHARRRNLDGVVVIQADFNSSEVIRLATGSIPTVIIDHEYEGCDCVLSDNRRSMEQIVEAVYNAGHRRIAFIHGEDGNVTRSRTAGFYKSCAEHGIKVPQDYVKEGHFHDPARCVQPLLELLNLPVPPTCILFPDDYSCLGNLGVLEARGIRIPEDLSIVGFDGIRLTEMMKPHLTTYSQDAWEIGHQAIRVVLDAIENEDGHEPSQIHVAGKLVEGETLGRM